jgi:hypothetical protein
MSPQCSVLELHLKLSSASGHGITPLLTLAKQNIEQEYIKKLLENEGPVAKTPTEYIYLLGIANK